MRRVTSKNPPLPTIPVEKNYTTVMHCQQCTHAGCRRKTCMQLPMCWQHARTQYHLQVKPSTIPAAGKGLFAWARTTKDRAAKAVVFKVGAFICPIKGRPTSQHDLVAHYGQHNVPYGAASSAAKTGQPFVDGLGDRWIGQYANTRLGVALADGRRRSIQSGTNATLSNRADGYMWVKATKAIRSGDEILTWYGHEYMLEPSATIK